MEPALAADTVSSKLQKIHGNNDQITLGQIDSDNHEVIQSCIIPKYKASLMKLILIIIIKVI